MSAAIGPREARGRCFALGVAAVIALGLAGCGSATDSGAAANLAGSSANATAGSGGSSAGGTGGAAGTTNVAGAAELSGSAGRDADSGSAGSAGMSAGGSSNSAGSANDGAGSGGTSAAGSSNGAGGCPGVFCEDFEHGSLDPAIWNTQTSGGQPAAVVQSAVVAHGKYAVQFHANVLGSNGKAIGQSYDFMITKAAPVALRGHHFGRAYFNVTPKPPAEHTAFLFAGSAGFPKLKYLEVAGIGSAWQLTYVDLIGGGESYASGGNAPQGRWTCLEWEFNDTPDQATVFVDGVQSYSRDSITFNGQTSGLVGGFSDFGFGYWDWHPASYEFDIYYDDIVLDTKRVGCLTAP